MTFDLALLELPKNLCYPEDIVAERARLLQEMSGDIEAIPLRKKLILISQAFTLFGKQARFEALNKSRAFAIHEVYRLREKNRRLENGSTVGILRSEQDISRPPGPSS